MASAASTMPTKPRTSIIPNASAICFSLAVDELLRLASGDAGQRGDGRLGGGVDLGLGAGQVQAPEGAVRGHVDQRDMRGLLGLVGGQYHVAGRLGLQDEQRLAG